MTGVEGRDEQIENYQETIRNLGRAGIPILGYSSRRTSCGALPSPPFSRGRARVSSFDHALVEHAPLTHGRVIDEAEMWSNYDYFLDAVLPVAEESGVVLALHPDDPPVESLGGVSRIFRTLKGSLARWIDMPALITSSTFAWGAGRKWAHSFLTSFATLDRAGRLPTSTCVMSKERSLAFENASSGRKHGYGRGLPGVA